MVAGVLLLDCTVRSIPATLSDRVAEALSTSVVNLSLTSCQVSSLDLRRMFILSSRDMITCRSSSMSSSSFESSKMIIHCLGSEHWYLLITVTFIVISQFWIAMTPSYDLILHGVNSRQHRGEIADVLGVLGYLLREASNLPLQVIKFQEHRNRCCLLGGTTTTC